MSVKSNQVVSINFTVKDVEGNVLDSTGGDQPFLFLSGHSQILPKLEENIDQMLIGSKKEVTLSPDEAYGDYDDKAVQVVQRSEFPENTKLEEGMDFMAQTPEGNKIPFVIKDIKGDEVTIDFNHPLAGQTLKFEVELLDKREATQEELSHGHAHGGDGHHHHHHH
jgi:FKBP-type peptidyl-prolyl cis-trans isomerase SlyD